VVANAGRVGLILTGGGARAAYQVGVLKAVGAIVGVGHGNPFPILCGTSAGAINAVALAARADQYAAAVREMEDVWAAFRARHVYRSDVPAIMRSGAKWLGAMMLVYRRNPISLLDNAPLRRLLWERIDFGRISRNVATGALDALSVTASGYASGHSVSFFETHAPQAGWQRIQRIGKPAKIGLDHLMASSALPFLFPAVRLEREFFGDGSMRQVAPVSPALHLGADRVFVIGTGRQVHEHEPSPRRRSIAYPSLAEIGGHALNSIFLDTLAQDIDWLRRINAAIALFEPERRATLPFRHIDVLVISPSESLDRIASRHVHELPRAVRFLLGTVGATRRSGANLASYLLFEPGFCRALIDLGERDAMARRDEIAAFFGRAAAAGQQPQAAA